MKMEQCVPKRRHIKSRRQGITQKKAYSKGGKIFQQRRSHLKILDAQRAAIINKFHTEDTKVFRQLHTIFNLLGSLEHGICAPLIKNLNNEAQILCPRDMHVLTIWGQIRGLRLRGYITVSYNVMP